MISGCECRMREDVRGEHPDGLELVELASIGRALEDLVNGVWRAAC